MTAYYNEHEKFAAAWLRELIKAGHIAPGIVDERSIEDVRPDELAGFTQCHFFAGIGIWSLALRRAGWPDDRQVWTGSCPCQPFSAAGKGAGFADERHLWPAFYHLISQRKPAIVLGEQVASKPVDNWIDLVQADMEAMGNAFGCVPFPSAGCGAPHIRDRAYWCATHLDGGLLGSDGFTATLANAVRPRRAEWRAVARIGQTARSGEFGGLANNDGDRCAEGREIRPVCEESDGQHGGATSILGNTGNTGNTGLQERECIGGVSVGQAGGIAGQAAERTGIHVGGMVEPISERFDRSGTTGSEDGARGGRIAASGHSNTVGGVSNSDGWQHQPSSTQPDQRAVARGNGAMQTEPCPTGPTNGLWRNADWLHCRDGKWRPVEPGTFPLADAGTYRNRVAELRGAGNAINLAAAQAFIESVMEAL